ncbi:MAG TPA: Rrf2 family transcriptional regulator [Chthonomonadaceae bacterium]|nr:Rrf2 family transcriptional regulator [Chthonomonadaceae bacterium]
MLSSRAKYATRALLDLSLHYDHGPVQIHEIARRQNIPVKFLEQILLALKLGGFVQSRKGPGGGYLLARPPDLITLGAVVRAMDGPIAPISCVSVSGFHECGCPDPDTCGLRTVWKEARDALARVLDGTNFADICVRHREHQGTAEEFTDTLLAKSTPKE